MHGIDILLKVKTETGKDSFERPVYSEEWVKVENVLVGSPSTEDIISELQISGKRLAYILGIPKGDQHVWVDTEVRFFDQTFKTFGKPLRGIDDLVPGPWGINVKVEQYE